MDEQNLIENIDLLNIIKILKTDYSSQVEADFYEKVQKSKFLLPAIVKNGNKISVVKIVDEEKKEYLPAFTDRKNFQLNNDNIEESQSVVFTFKEYLNILNTDLNLHGIVINPYSDNLVLSRENLNQIFRRENKFQLAPQKNTLMYSLKNAKIFLKKKVL